jgi:prepilin-type processing-associated H-X9-DG protein
MIRPRKLNEQGFTLVEVMLIIAIISTLVVTVISLYPKMTKRADNAKCVAKMVNAHQAFANYLAANKTWPQMPEVTQEGAEEDYWEFWLKAGEPFGLGADGLLCPTDERNRKSDGKERDKYEGTYGVTRFDEGWDVPYKWNQPWLTEGGDYHDGQNVIFPDGHVAKGPKGG